MPVATPIFLIAGSTTAFTAGSEVCCASTATFLPSSVPCFFSSWNSTASERSGVVPGKTIRPGGTCLSMSCVTWKVTTGV